MVKHLVSPWKLSELLAPYGSHAEKHFETVKYPANKHVGTWEAKAK